MTDIKYIPFRSQISDEFWVEVHDRKLNKWGLDPSPHVLYGLFSGGNAESPILSLDRWSFSAEECLARANVHSVPICGTLLMVESVGDFKQISKQALLNSDGHSLWNTYISSVGPVAPEYSVRFLILCFANMKDNSTVYWVSYPSILVQHEHSMADLQPQKKIFSEIIQFPSASSKGMQRRKAEMPMPLSVVTTYESYLHNSVRILTKPKTASALQSVLPHLSASSAGDIQSAHETTPPPSAPSPTQTITDLFRLQISESGAWIHSNSEAPNDLRSKITKKARGKDESDDPDALVDCNVESTKISDSSLESLSDASISSDEYYCFLLSFAACVERRKPLVTFLLGASAQSSQSSSTSPKEGSNHSTDGNPAAQEKSSDSAAPPGASTTPSPPLATVIFPSKRYTALYGLAKESFVSLDTSYFILKEALEHLPSPTQLPVFFLQNKESYVCLSYEEAMYAYELSVELGKNGKLPSPSETCSSSLHNSTLLCFTNLVSHSMDVLSHEKNSSGGLAFPGYYRSLFSLALTQSYISRLRLQSRAALPGAINSHTPVWESQQALSPTQKFLSFAPNFAILQQVLSWLQSSRIGTGFHDQANSSHWEELRASYLKHLMSVLEVCPYRFIDHSRLHSMSLSLSPAIQNDIKLALQDVLFRSIATDESSESTETVPSTDTQVSLPNVHKLAPTSLPALPTFLAEGWAHLIPPYSECTMPSSSYQYQAHVRHRLPAYCLTTGWEIGDKGKPAPRLSRIALIKSSTEPATGPNTTEKDSNNSSVEGNKQTLINDDSQSSSSTVPIRGRAHGANATSAASLAVDAVSTSTDLNLSLMKWRLLPELNKASLQNCRVLLLGAGTLGCFVSRCLLAWGMQNITLVDNGKVSFSNLTRQPLYDIYDAVSSNYAIPSDRSSVGGIHYVRPLGEQGSQDVGHGVSGPDGIRASYKALAAADSLRRIQPAARISGVVMSIPMPGSDSNPKIKETPILVTAAPGVSLFPTAYSSSPSQNAQSSESSANPANVDADTTTHLDALAHLIRSHDAVFLLTDSRESRWTPTFLGGLFNVPTFTVALGFDSLIVVRHGLSNAASAKPDSPKSFIASNQSTLGCYFCIDPYAVPGTNRRILNESLDDIHWMDDEPTALSMGAGESGLPPVTPDASAGAFDPSMDQKCTVTRPAVAPIASAMAVELLVSLLHHPDGFHAAHETGDGIGSSTKSPLGICPHIFRFFLSHYLPIQGVVAQSKQCSACSPLAKERLLGIPSGASAPFDGKVAPFQSDMLSFLFTEDGGSKLYDIIWTAGKAAKTTSVSTKRQPAAKAEKKNAALKSPSNTSNVATKSSANASAMPEEGVQKGVANTVATDTSKATDNNKASVAPKKSAAPLIPMSSEGTRSTSLSSDSAPDVSSFAAQPVPTDGLSSSSAPSKKVEATSLKPPANDDDWEVL